MDSNRLKQYKELNFSGINSSVKKWEFKYANDSERIIGSALDTLGLDRKFLFVTLGIPFDSNKKWDSQNVGASEWFIICSALCLSADSISYGYSLEEHTARIRYHMNQGDCFQLPKTPAIRILLREAKDDKLDEARWRRKHYGFRLHAKIQFREFKQRLLNAFLH